MHSHQKMAVAQQWLSLQAPSCALGCCMQCLAAREAEPGAALKSQASPEVLCAHGAGCRVDLEDDLRFLRGFQRTNMTSLCTCPYGATCLQALGAFLCRASGSKLALPLWHMGIFYPNKSTHVGQNVAFKSTLLRQSN